MMDMADKQNAVQQMEGALAILWNQSRELLADNPELTPEADFMEFRNAYIELEEVIERLSVKIGVREPEA